VELLEIVKGPSPRALALVGELDASTAHYLADALAAQHEERGDVRLDLSRLVFLDSVGLSALIATARRLGGGDQLVLVSPQETVRRTLQISGVAGAMPNLVVEDG
jgi:anti-anti-sigma factor